MLKVSDGRIYEERRKIFNVIDDKEIHLTLNIYPLMSVYENSRIFSSFELC